MVTTNTTNTANYGLIRTVQVMQVMLYGDLSPSALDPEVHRRVAYAVGRAAVESGVGDADGLAEIE